jgi:hypothetical protein
MYTERMLRSLPVAALLFATSTLASAQWFNVRTPGIPRLPDGTANLSAPTPRTQDGKPDLAGIWKPSPPYIGNIASDLKPGDAPFQPWAAELFKQRRATESKDDPTGNCIPGGVPRSDAVPYPFKIVNSEKMVIILYEAVHSYRQIFTDGRELPKDPNPAWLGYSVGHWDGDTLVVESSGFNGKTWLDAAGHPTSDALHITERFRRKDFGHLELEITIDDPKMYTQPWTVKESPRLLADSELLEFNCNENERDVRHLVQ